jgi:hypothetical protein
VEGACAIDTQAIYTRLTLYQYMVWPSQYMMTHGPPLRVSGARAVSL